MMTGAHFMQRGTFRRVRQHTAWKYLDEEFEKFDKIYYVFLEQTLQKF